MPEISDEMHDWFSQARQYPQRGRPGIQLISPEIVIFGHATIVDCLLFYAADGNLAGIFNHFNENNPQQEPDTANLWVHPDYQRQGIATALLRRADELWVLPDQPTYTPAGNAWIEGLIAKGSINAGRTHSVEGSPHSRSAQKFCTVETSGENATT